MSKTTIAPEVAAYRAARSKWVKSATGSTADIYRYPNAPWRPGANLFPLIGDPAVGLREAFAWARDESNKREVEIVWTPETKWFYEPVFLDLTDARYTPNLLWRLPWDGLGYQGPTGTHAITFRNAHWLRSDGLCLTLCSDGVGGIKLEGASISNNRFERGNVRVAADRRECQGITIGDRASNDVCNNVFRQYTSEAPIRGESAKERLAYVSSMGNVGIRMAGGNNLANKLEDCAFTGFRDAISTWGRDRWEDEPGGASSVLYNVGGSWNARFLRVAGGFEFNWFGGRVEDSAVLCDVGEPNYGGESQSSVGIHGVTAQGMLSVNNREIGMGDPDSIIRFHCPGSYVADVSAKFREVPTSAISLATSDPNSEVVLKTGGNLADFGYRIMEGNASVDNTPNGMVR